MDTKGICRASKWGQGANFVCCAEDREFFGSTIKLQVRTFFRTDPPLLPNRLTHIGRGKCLFIGEMSAKKGTFCQWLPEIVRRDHDTGQRPGDTKVAD